MYRWAAANLEVLLVHPGGPYWREKDEGAWSLPKGKMDEGENAELAARAAAARAYATMAAFTFWRRWSGSGA